MYCKIHNSFNKVCALVAATLILPALAYADHDRKGDKDERNDHGNKHNLYRSIGVAGISLWE
jgi:hypothetical protein